MTVSAKIILDSISPEGIRLTSIQVILHRYVLAEFNTHRVFSRNFRSSRAVPVAKLLTEVRENPAIPVAWLKNKAGMQATEPMTPEEEDIAKQHWLAGANHAADTAELLAQSGLHKQWANRGLEPYLYVHGLVTSTNWANFYALRRHPDAQPEMRVLADAMWRARKASTPKRLQPGEWHLPYIDLNTDIGRLPTPPKGHNTDKWFLECLQKISIARCARVSYRTHDDCIPDVEEDMRLYERLVGSVPLHASPAEHQSTPDEREGGNGYPCYWANSSEHGNFYGWRQLRKMLPNECGKDH